MAGREIRRVKPEAPRRRGTNGPQIEPYAPEPEDEPAAAAKPSVPALAKSRSTSSPPPKPLAVYRPIMRPVHAPASTVPNRPPLPDVLPDMDIAAAYPSQPAATAVDYDPLSD